VNISSVTRPAFSSQNTFISAVAQASMRSAQLRALQAVHPNIVAVLGDGHIPGISRLLQGFGLEHEVLRLSELRSEDFLKRWQDNRLRPEGGLPPGASVSFTFHLEETPPDGA
jgi:hypothetical protein